MKICFDECLAVGWMRRLSEILARHPDAGIECLHVCDHRKGSPDDAVASWAASQSPRAILVSKDNAMKGRAADPRLPIEAPKAGVTSIFLSRGLGQVKGFEQMRLLLVLLPDILHIYNSEPPGSRWRIRRQTARGDRSPRYHLDAWDV